MPLASKVKSKVEQRQAPVKMKIKRGDTVVVISGKDKGKRGLVASVHPSSLSVVVDGLNLVTRHQKARPKGMGSAAAAQQGGRIQKPAPLHVSKVMLIEPHKDTPTRVGRKSVEGKLVRYAKASGELIDPV